MLLTINGKYTIKQWCTSKLLCELVADNPGVTEFKLDCDVGLSYMMDGTDISLDIDDEKFMCYYTNLLQELGYLGCDEMLTNLFDMIYRVAYDTISKEVSFDVGKQWEKFYDKHLGKVNWWGLSCNTNLSEEFFEKHLNEVNWVMLSYNTNLSEEFFEKHIGLVNWCELSGNTNMSMEFYTKHIDKVNWWVLSCNTNLSEEFFKKHLGKVDWWWLSGNTNISEEFFELHIELVNWVKLSSNTNMSMEFYTKHLDKVDWVELSRNNQQAHIKRKTVQAIDKLILFPGMDHMWKRCKL